MAVSDRPFLPIEVRTVLADIEHRIEFADTEALLRSASSIRDRFEEIEDCLPEDLLSTIHPMAYIEFRRLDYLRAQRNIQRCTEARALQAAADAALEISIAESSKLEVLQKQQEDAENRLYQLRKELEDLKAALVAKEQKVSSAESALATLRTATNRQSETVSAAVSASERAWSAVPAQVDPSAEDLNTIAEINSLRSRALSVLRDYLHPHV